MKYAREVVVDIEKPPSPSASVKCLLSQLWRVQSAGSFQLSLPSGSTSEAREINDFSRTAHNWQLNKAGIF